MSFVEPVENGGYQKTVWERYQELRLERAEFNPTEKEKIDLVLNGKDLHYSWEIYDLVLAIRLLNERIEFLEGKR